MGLNNMLKILINSYTCCPNMGSEPGMGWNWIVTLASHCELFIVTEGEYRPQIEAWLADSKNAELARNLHFYWNPIGQNELECQMIRKMCWNQGDWRFYKYYKKWQRKTAEIAEAICKKEKIDILHQLNMIGFREPGFLWLVSKKTGIPFVWGPIDAKDSFPMSYAKNAGFKTRLFLLVKNLITRIQLKFDCRVKAAARQASFVIGASSNSIESLKKYLNIDAELINETGCRIESNSVSVCKPYSEYFDVLWVGKFDFRKQLELALRTIASINEKRIRLHIVGGGNDMPYRDLADKIGISTQCIWHGAVSHETVQKIMRQSDVFLFTSVAEGTPHVVLEAISNNLPVVCFDTCGHGDCVDDSVGMKIPLTHPEQSIKDFAQAITYLYNDREKLAWLSANCLKRALELSWEQKALQMLELYKSAVLASKKEMPD